MISAIGGVMKFIYNGLEYPNIICKEEDYEKVEVIIPFLNNEYFLAVISSAGEYELIDDNLDSDKLVLLEG